MRSIVTLITAAAFLLHFALGCCAHHAHAAEGADCIHQMAGAAKKCQHHHGHSHDNSSKSDGTSGEPGHTDEECAGGHCVFMGAGKTSVAKITLSALLPLFFDTTCLSQPVQLIEAAIDSGGPIALPVRIHLFNQVFLI